MDPKNISDNIKLVKPKLYNKIPTGPGYSYEFDFEKSFVHKDGVEWMQNHWKLSCYLSVAYVIVIFAIKFFMRNREPFKLRKFLVVWNLCLSTFSIFGSIRFTPEVIYVLKNFGFHYSVCNRSYVEDHEVTAFWTWMFCLSKLPELGDTLFIVLRKQKLIFLHWYHHITVFIFTWISYSQNISVGRWYIVMNYLVHSLMYTYYTLRASNIRLPKPLAMVITFSQILQMIVGFYVTLHSYIYTKTCHMPEQTAIYGLLMYGSYFVLFTNFFINAYFGKPRIQKTKKTN